MSEKRFGASIGDIIKARQEPGNKPEEEEIKERETFLKMKLEDLGLTRGATVEEIKKEMEKRGLEPVYMSDLVAKGWISADTEEYHNEQMEKIRRRANREQLKRILEQRKRGVDFEEIIRKEGPGPGVIARELVALVEQDEAGLLPEGLEKSLEGYIGEIKKGTIISASGSDITEGTPEQTHTSEEEAAFNNVREVLDRLRQGKRSKEGLTTMELSDLDLTLSQLLEIAQEIKENEYYAIFQESVDKFGQPSLVSRERGRKIIILDKMAKVKPSPGKRYKVRVIKDTAPGERHGVMFVNLAEE